MKSNMLKIKVFAVLFRSMLSFHPAQRTRSAALCVSALFACIHFSPPPTPLSVFLSYHHRKVFCASEGIVCGGVGTCVNFGCECEDTAGGTIAGGDFCTADQKDLESVGTRAFPPDVSITMTAVAAVTIAHLSSWGSVRGFC